MELMDVNRAFLASTAGKGIRRQHHHGSPRGTGALSRGTGHRSAGTRLYVAAGRRVVRMLTSDRVDPIDTDIRNAGFQPGSQELSFGLVAADNEPSLQRLNLGAVVFRLERVLLANGEPVGIDTLWLPPSLGEMLKDKLSGRFVMPLLEQYGQDVDHIDYRFEAATAPGSHAALLKVTTGWPLLVIHFTPISPKGLPVLAGRPTTRADRFIYEFCAKPKAIAKVSEDALDGINRARAGR